MPTVTSVQHGFDISELQMAENELNIPSFLSNLNALIYLVQVLHTFNILQDTSTS
jgi:hypothetical protein